MKRQLSAIELMANGYSPAQKEQTTQAQEVTGSIQKDNPDERPLSAIEKLIAGYTPESKGKEMGDNE